MVDMKVGPAGPQAPSLARVGATLLALVVAVATGLALVAPTVASGSSHTTVTVDGSGLNPESLETSPGTTVTWENADSERRRIRSVEAPGDAEFDSGNLEPGESFTHTFASTAGTYRYVDHRNDEDTNYHGTVTVTQGAQGDGGTAQGDGGTAQGDGGTAQGDGGAAQGPISLRGRQFTPPEVTVQVGDTVEWLNDDDEEHTVTATGGPFDSGTLAEGGNFSHTFTEPGTYSYLCNFHPDMTGTITVQGADGSAPPPAASGEDAGAPDGGGDAPQPGDAGGAPTPGAAAPGGDAPGSASVSMRDIAFGPPTVTVAPGGTVTWTNEEAVPHTVTADDGTFDSGTLDQGATFSHTFDSPGEYSYVCEFHPGMAGVVVVPNADGSAPPPSASGGGAGAPDGGANVGRLGGGGGGGGASASDAAAPGGDAPDSASVSMRDIAFNPPTVTVAPGGTVTWTNEEAVPHTVTADDGTFDSGTLDQGATFSHTFDSPGEYSYVCELHPGMEGVVVVSENASDSPSADSSPDSASSGTAELEGSPSPDAAGEEDSAPKEAQVDVGDFFFEPEEVTVRAGGTVTWTLTGEAPHTVTAKNDAFESGQLEPGEQFTHTFEETGTFSYLCALHPNMVGTVKVVDASSDEPGGSDAGSESDDEESASGGEESAAGGGGGGDGSGTQASWVGGVPLLPVAVASGLGAGAGILFGLVLLPALNRGLRRWRPGASGSGA